MKHKISEFNQNAQILSSPENSEIPSLLHFLHFSKLYHDQNLPLWMDQREMPGNIPARNFFVIYLFLQ